MIKLVSGRIVLTKICTDYEKSDLIFLSLLLLNELKYEMQMKKLVILLIFLMFFIFHAFTQTQALFFQRILPNKIDLIDENFWRAPYDSVSTPHTSNSYLIGNSITFNLLGDSHLHLKQLLEKVLSLSETTSIPVHIHLDGQNWIAARPDLWNWFDPSIPGYNPENRKNVEWTSWTPDSAVKVCWRDWGQQIRVLPAPNIASPAILNAHYEAYDLLLPIIIKWIKHLPAAKKYLFGGIRIGWEAGINYNAYYYKNGNEIFDKHPSTTEYDPKGRTTTENFSLDSNTLRLGYAAASTSNIQTEGELTNAVYEKIVHRYVETLCRYVTNFGFTPKELFTHIGGNYAPFDKHLKFWPAINRYATPGWSFYSMDPSSAGSLSDELKTAGLSQWAASEWLWPGQTSDEWCEHLRKTYSFKDCRLLVIYNWEFMIDRDVIAQKGIRKFLSGSS
ncbi:hypothetical protein SAMN05444349_104139 [Bacteroides faecichinchillae]|uniref:Uncharacterized protein n=2 Tax=Bacteroides faecichinchillae TaxID=871325 RepID=A0A1M4V9D5_9BACE|nr:hypothetical protein SAMN05444349_104139 [Bacteroides faecichinchillae]